MAKTLKAAPQYLSEPFNFCALPAELSGWTQSRAVVLPVPYEATTSYRKGTGQGPSAIIEASRHLETFDEELKTETAARVGIHTLPSLVSETKDAARALDRMGQAAARIVRAGKWPLILGGEHTLSYGILKGLKRVYPKLGVLHFDAHADLRSEYLGDPLSHACANYLIRTLDCPTVSLGIRSLSEPEYRLIRRDNIPVFFSSLAGDLAEARRDPERIVEKICRLLPPDIYVTIDLDAFDPAVVPAVGTPEPGGLSWEDVLAVLRPVFRRKNVVAADIVELAPLGEERSSDFLAAKLGYRLIGYKFCGRK